MEERQNATRKIIERMKQDENTKSSEGNTFIYLFMYLSIYISYIAIYLVYVCP